MPEVQATIALLRTRAQSHTEIYTQAVLARWWQLATADARELTAVHRVNCRNCHGLDHRHQFTLEELRVARHRYAVLGELWDYTYLDQHHRHGRFIRRLTEAEINRPFDDLGGDGFDPWGDPKSDCTECGGRGLPQVWVADSRHLSPAAALLYDGVEVSRDGTMRVKMRDRSEAERVVTAALGIAPRAGRDAPAEIHPDRMSDDQLAATVERFRALGLIDDEMSVEDAHGGTGEGGG